jgi:hypothetical protein
MNREFNLHEMCEQRISRLHGIAIDGRDEAKVHWFQYVVINPEMSSIDRLHRASFLVCALIFLTVKYDQCSSKGKRGFSIEAEFSPPRH